MKKITLLLMFCFVMIGGNAQCNYTLQMNDAYGDGWEGFTLNVLVNGTIVLEGVTLAGLESTITFPVNDDDDITTSVNTNGDYDEEVTYSILDTNEIEVGNGDANNDILTGTIEVVCGDQCDYSLQMNDAYGDGWEGFTLDVLVNGTIILEGVTLLGLEETLTFPVDDGDDITTSVNTNGDYDEEVTYSILDTNGIEVGNGDANNDILIGTILAVSDCGDQCNYTLQMNDAYGDGWEGFTLNVLVNDIIILEGVTLLGLEATLIFSVENGDNITTSVNSNGNYDEEVTYSILDTEGMVAGNGDADNDITLGTIVAVSDCGELCNYTLVMNDAYGDGWEGFSLNVVVNGTIVLDGVTLLGLEETLTFPVNDGDDITTSVNTNGNYDEEVTYSILDINDAVVGNGDADNNILTGSLTANCGTLTISDFDESLFNYYPNPADNYLTITAHQKINSIVIYDVIGNEVFKTAPNSLVSVLDVSSLNSGTYFMNVIMKNKNKVVKVVKK